MNAFVFRYDNLTIHPNLWHSFSYEIFAHFTVTNIICFFLIFCKVFVILFLIFYHSRTKNWRHLPLEITPPPSHLKKQSMNLGGIHFLLWEEDTWTVDYLDRTNNFPVFLDVFWYRTKKTENYLFRFNLFNRNYLKFSIFFQIFGSKNKKLENYLSGFFRRFLI